MFDVRSALTGAQVIAGVPEDVARDECARLNAEARVINPATGKPTGLECGQVTTYIVVDVTPPPEPETDSESPEPDPEPQEPNQ